MAVAWGGGMKLSMNNDIPVAFKLTDSRLNFKHVGASKSGESSVFLLHFLMI